MNTSWTTDDIWLRREFTLDAENLTRLALQIFHDEDVEIYLNGVLAAKAPSYSTDYLLFPISEAAKEAIHAGSNSIAVHCHQTSGGQGIDVGIVIPQPEPGPETKQ